ncbi:MAG: hypothetical protein RL272_657 [Candidatus Parcubacteria bacterium]|jgi:4,5-DOPA dioxygenase extradiol
MELPNFKKSVQTFPDTPKMPVLFVGHGSPMNLVEDTAWSRAWRKMGKSLPRPNAILCVSAHWFVDGTYVHVAERPRTIYDYYGFPPELYKIRYDCPGAPAFAKEAARIVTKADVRWDTEWGIDHGAFLPLFHLFPEADVPTFQLSVDFTKPARFHYDLAKGLAPLRRKGVLIVGSGNIVHNLGVIRYERDAAPFDWAEAFDRKAAALIADGDHQTLIDHGKLGEAALLSIPTPDHYFPMLSALALQEKGEDPEFFTQGIAHGSVSMRSFIISGKS